MDACGKKRPGKLNPTLGPNEGHRVKKKKQATVPGAGLVSTGSHSAQGALFECLEIRTLLRTEYVLACVSHNSGHDQLAGMLRNSST